MLGLRGKRDLTTAFLWIKFYQNTAVFNHFMFLCGKFCSGMAGLLSGPLLKQFADP